MRRLLLALLLLAGCQDYLFDQVCPEAIRESSVIVPAAKPTPADILFVVDNSGSMADEQENLAANFDRFISQIAGAGDYHIAVVTTDQESTPAEKEGLQNFVFADTYPNILTDFTLAGCGDVSPSIAHGCFRGPDPSTRIVDSETMDPATQISVFAQNVRVGSCGSGTETGLKSMISALDQRNGCNTGFLRDNANLIVVIVSDEDDSEPETDVRQYVERLKAIKPVAQIRVAMIVGYVNGRADNCNITGGAQCGSLCDNPPPVGSHQPCGTCAGGEICLSNQCENPLRRYISSCNSCSFYNTPDCCSAVAGGRYVAFALQMEQEITQADSSIAVTDCKGGNGMQRVACRVDTICQANFGDTLTSIARDLVIGNTYNLNPPAAYPPGVSVTVKNGRFGPEGKKLVYGTDFVINDEGSVLTLQGENTPIEGEDIEIHFVVDSENRVEAPRGACTVSGSP